MPSSWTDGARASGPVIFSFWPAALLLAVVVLGGCVTTQERGDRAYESNQYNQALDHYERAIDSGSTDPELYYRAAKAAVRVGDFALAERYYSRALRHGGDEEVVRSLAEFYIATSNYTKAVRVLQQ
ncbi:MAG: tetratricopeptide repeat protein, partial [Persicimonas sp.]